MSAESRIRVKQAMERQRGVGQWAIAVDTNLIGGPPSTDPNGFQLDKLGVLRGVSSRGDAVFTTSVWQLEALRHLQLTLEDRTQPLKKAAHRLEELGVEPFAGLASSIKVSLAGLPSAGDVWSNFREHVRMQEVPVGPDDAAECLDRYQQGRVPFEAQKKEEFPDALSLIALNRYAEQNNYNIVVATNDNGCLGYCGETQRLHGFSTLAGAVEALSIRNDVKARVAAIPTVQQLVCEPTFVDAARIQVMISFSETWHEFGEISAPAPLSGRPQQRCIVQSIELDPTDLLVASMDEHRIHFEVRLIALLHLDVSLQCTSADWQNLYASVSAEVSIDQRVEFVRSVGPPLSINLVREIKTEPDYQPKKPEWAATRV